MEDITIEVPATQDATVTSSGDHLEVAIDDSLAEIARNLPLDREENVLSGAEREILELFTELQELELEQAVLRAEADDDGKCSPGRRLSVSCINLTTP